MKICKKCNIEKSFDDYHNLKSSKDGKQPKCKICVSEIQKTYVKNNREKILERKKEYRESEHGKLIRQEYRQEYYLKNKELENKRSNEWNKNNKDKMKKYKNEYSKLYAKNNPHIIGWRRILHNSLRNLGQIKEGNTIDLLGYSALELKESISKLFTEGMSWDNYGEWHIDHIKPINSFTTDAPINVVNALSNLQPLWATTREINGVTYLGNLNKWAN